MYDPQIGITYIHFHPIIIDDNHHLHSFSLSTHYMIIMDHHLQYLMFIQPHYLCMIQNSWAPQTFLEASEVSNELSLSNKAH